MKGGCVFKKNLYFTRISNLAVIIASHVQRGCWGVQPNTTTNKQESEGATYWLPNLNQHKTNVITYCRVKTISIMVNI